MTRDRVNRVLAIALCVVLAGVSAAGVGRYAYLQALAQTEKQAAGDLTLATDRFTGELRRFRELAVLLADHPVLAQLPTDPALRASANATLQAAADRSGAMALFYTDTSGRILALAGGVNLEPAGAAYFERAMQGALGSFFGRIGPDGQRVYAYAAPSFTEDGPVRGSLIVLVDIAEVEWDWIGDQPAVFFTDGDDRVFLSNRSDILGWRKRSDSQPLVPDTDPAPAFKRVDTGGFDIWHMDWGDYLPSRALHLGRDVPLIGMRAHALLDTAPATRVATLQGAIIGLICLVFGLGFLWLTDRRRRLALANANLERRVRARTAELSATNRTLRREVAEREEAEAALKRAQADLVQAGKLSALGQMSAGISHELNQPLMAIQQFADNGTAFLDKGRTDMAADNLSRIGQLATRAGRIIKNLRAFARNESEPMGKVDLVQVIETAVELTAPRLSSDGVQLDWTAPKAPIYAVGGEVRLAQVFVNLINNATDAMTGRDEKRISISLETQSRLSVSVEDTGPGLTEPDKIFEPFYSTKSVGSDEGMGLGLSISYGLVQSFGGNIRGSNADGGGALFRVELEPWTGQEPQQEAAE